MAGLSNEMTRNQTSQDEMTYDNNQDPRSFMFSQTPNVDHYNDYSQVESQMFAGVDVSIVNDRLANMSGLSSPTRNQIKPDKSGRLLPGQHSEIRSYQPSRSCCTDLR